MCLCLVCVCVLLKESYRSFGTLWKNSMRVSVSARATTASASDEDALLVGRRGKASNKQQATTSNKQQATSNESRKKEKKEREKKTFSVMHPPLRVASNTLCSVALWNLVRVPTQLGKLPAVPVNKQHSISDAASALHQHQQQQQQEGFWRWLVLVTLALVIR